MILTRDRLEMELKTGFRLVRSIGRNKGITSLIVERDVSVNTGGIRKLFERCSLRRYRGLSLRPPPK